MKPSNGILRLILPVVCCLAFLSACSNSNSESPEAAARPEKVVPVTVETVTAGSMTETFTLPAGTEAWEDLLISAELSGTVQKIHFSEGDSVAAGDLLLEIDPDTIKSYLVRDRENVKVIGRKLERYRELATEGLVSRQDIDDLENSLAAAQATLETTRLQLARSRPKAPVSGFVDRLDIDRGEYVEPGKSLLRLVQVDKLKVIADVPEKDVHFLSVGQQVEIIPATVNRPVEGGLTGTIEHIAFAADEVTRTYRTKIVIDNHDLLLRPGMIVRARFVRRELTDVISVPLYAVLDRDGDKIVFVAADGVAKLVHVTIGNSVDQRLIIRDGLAAGQQLIVKGQQLLSDGARISIGEN